MVGSDVLVGVVGGVEVEVGCEWREGESELVQVEAREDCWLEGLSQSCVNIESHRKHRVYRKLELTRESKEHFAQHLTSSCVA